AGASAERMTKDGGYEAFESPNADYVFFTKDRSHPGLWRIPVQGGKEEFVASDVREGLWTIVRGGVLAIHAGNLRRWSFNEGQWQNVMAIPHQSAGLWSGFAATWDSHTIAWTQTVDQRSDIMVREGPL